ncbi:MAG: aminotransferase class III-fold pyridoxal phosphate-dependent enzyme [Steroidobacteraceae bacterium]|nr:aminotransferase class III-fold pyridoxal phosphate-dependent enzyme [Steroidobacteraceae bacterium]MDW8258682.1 aminotransferase class III-fold pyridoxal phosphate-dependent enzyme [Gammaproteobacteria bacterium]
MNRSSTPTPVPDAATARDFLAPVFAQYPIEVTDAAGVWLHTRDGRRILDLYGGHAVAALGYGHPGWTAAVQRQAAACNFQSNAVPMAIRARAAERLARFAGGGFDSVFFVNSGAEANENALRMAFKMTQRAHVAAIEGAFHGRTAAAGALTDGARDKWYAFPRTPFDVSFIPRRDLAAIAAHVTERTAAVIVEPVQGVGGAVDLGREFLLALRRRCDAVGALLIFDEVQSGMGRSGWPFAANMYGLQPDMLTAAKALGNGFPVAALLMTPRVTAALQREGLGTTFGGGPMACAAVEAVIDALERDDLLANVRRVAAYIRRTCTVGPVVGHQGAGFLHGLICARPAREVQAALLARNILCGTSADPRVLRLLPPYTLQESHVDLLREALESLD